jgi:shikimate dehydrogenase
MRAPERLVLLGHPVAHSLSPRIQTAALHAAGINARYEALDVDPSTFEGTIRELVLQRCAGNVTVPFKERMFDACAALTPLARRVGAVNTWWVDGDGRLVGDNTDVGGFDAAARALLGAEPRNITVGVLGAGGAAAGVLAAVELWVDCTAHVFNRTPERARALCERFRSVAQPVDDVGVIAGADLVVNATSVGLNDDALPIDLSLLRDDCVVLDLVYKPGETQFVRDLHARGIRAKDGITMLVEQAALAFEKWFDVTADRSAMWRSLRPLE